MANRPTRLIKIIWLPIVLLILIALEPYIGVWKSQYWPEYLGLQAILLVIYAYILYMDTKKNRAAFIALKGKRKNKK
jgi:hypothetical protein